MKGSKPKKPQAAITGENITNNPPEWLNPIAREIWKITIERVGSAGSVLPLKFTETFTGYCQSAAAAREADEILSREGLTVCDGRAGTRRHPLVSVRSQALLQLRSYAESLGLTPASQGRLPATTAPSSAAARVRAQVGDEIADQYLAKFGREMTNPFEQFDL